MAEPHNCTFTLQIEATLDAAAVATTGVRFRFLDGSKRQSPTFGAAGWTPVAPATTGASESPEETPPSEPTAVVHRWEQVVHDVAVTEAFASSIDDDPILSFFLFDQPLGAAAAAAGGHAKDPKKATESVAAANAAPDHHAHAYVGLCELDVSSLLAGRAQVEQTWSTEKANEDSDLGDDSFSFGSKRKKPAEESSSSSLMLFSISSQPTGLRQLTIRLVLNQPLLSTSLMEKLNPLTLTIARIRDLPGVPAHSPHTPLRQHCKPAFATLQFYPSGLHRQGSIGSTATAHSWPRMVSTSFKRQDGSIKWDHSITFLSSRFPTQQLLDTLEFATLTVEVHDRDLLQQTALTKLRDKWESLHTAAEPHTGAGASSRTTTPRNGAHRQPNKPMDLYAVDEIARHDWWQLLSRSGELFPYGLATFRLAELLTKRVRPQPAASVGTPYITIRLSADVIPMKRRASPVGSLSQPDDDESSALVSLADLTPVEKLIQEPGAYVTKGTTLRLDVSLHRFIERPSGVAPLSSDTPTVDISARFSRLVLIFPYNDSATLQQVTKIMNSVNKAALPGVPLASYQMSNQEKADCESGVLDVITGTQLIDSQYRMVILEGLADGGMVQVHKALPRQGAHNAKGYRLNANEQLHFTQRLYTCFEVDLKRIKLRYPLAKLLHMPDIYMRTKVSKHCFEALVRLNDMRQAQSLADIKQLQLFPTAHMLLEVESKYGESITMEDIEGQPTAKKGSSTKLKASEIVAPETLEADTPSPSKATNTASTRHSKTFKAPTDSKNDEYDRFRRSRTESDFLLERKQESERVRAEYETKKAEMEARFSTQPQAPVYLYSGQKLRTQDALQEEMRRRLALDHNTTYTYSREFHSQTLSLVNPEALQQLEEQEQRKRWTTVRGFVYPAPRKPGDYYKHADAPSEARCEDLRAPFVDNESHPKPVSRVDGSRPGDHHAHRPEFSTLPSKDMVFGGTNGDGSVNAEYFRSVHLCGQGLRQEMEEALQREQQAWEQRLVVDKSQLKFLAHGNTCSTTQPAKPSQLNKLSDLLAGPVRSKPLRIVRNATLPSGKRVPLQAAPATIHNQDEYTGSVATVFARSLRPTDAGHFVATDEQTGRPQDFFFPSNTDLLTPPVKKHTTYKTIAPVTVADKRGLFWANTTSRASETTG